MAILYVLGVGNVNPSKHSKWKKIVIRTILIVLAIIIIIPTSFVGYVMARYYIFYPRTLSEVRNSILYERDGTDESYRKPLLDSEITKPIKYIDGYTTFIKSGVYLHIKSSIDDKYIDVVCKKYKAEIIGYSKSTSDSKTFRSFCIQLKNEYTFDELLKVINEINEDPNVHGEPLLECFFWLL